MKSWAGRRIEVERVRDGWACLLTAICAGVGGNGSEQ